jgi:hypothetical protein
MLDYYELKATDHIIDQIDEEEDLFTDLDRRHKAKPKGNYRDRSNSLKKNIKKYERLSKNFKSKNLNDSRENDFDGFEEDLE